MKTVIDTLEAKIATLRQELDFWSDILNHSKPEVTERVQAIAEHESALAIIKEIK